MLDSSLVEHRVGRSRYRAGELVAVAWLYVADRIPSQFGYLLGEVVP